MLPLSYDSPLSILVVDDEPAIRFVLGMMLREDGHSVALAGSGAEALQRFQTQPWDIVLTDRVMEEMDGEQLARAIRKLSPRTPILMVTGFAPVGCCSEVDEIVRKPFTREVLSAAISRCLAAVTTDAGSPPGALPAAA